MAGELQALQAKVTEVEGISASIVALTGGLAQYIRDHASDPAALTAMATQLDASGRSMSAAVTANPLPTDTVPGGGTTVPPTDPVPPVEPPVEPPVSSGSVQATNPDGSPQVNPDGTPVMVPGTPAPSAFRQRR